MQGQDSPDDEVQQKMVKRLWLNKYIKPEGLANLHNYKYAGADEGISYKLFYNPVANWLTSKLPDSIAPNTLTLLGFLHCVVALLVTIGVYGTNCIGTMDGWICYLYAYLYFWYRMLDEMDGKQARRTGNSSPLGLLFDHGCDAF